MEQAVLTVTELNLHMKALVEADPFLGNVCVRGELSNYKIYPSGHHYFTLKDAESSVKCVMFRSAASRLRFTPESGMGVTVLGRLSVYPRDGAYQLYCESLLPEGEGDLQVAFQQLKEKLDREGLFDPAHKKPLPRYPASIAVITSPAGAAVHDIIRVCGRRWPMAELKLLPVRVQGAEAPAEIAGALRYANRYNVGELIITGRGGGSMEDLWCFNDERVARAIYESRIPVISAVGHEPDVTIADYVSDLRAATPSNAAELAVPDQQEQRELLCGAGARMAQALTRTLASRRQSLEELASRRVMKSPTGFIDQRRVELDGARAALLSAADSAMHRRRNDFTALASKLDALSPLKVLSRGYSIALRKNGAALRDARDADIGEALTLRLERGRLECLVEGKTDG